MPAPLRPPVAFAHRGASAHEPENTLDAFRLALRLGAGGLESDVWRTADGVLVLHHDRMVRAGLRRRAVTDLRRDQLPGSVPTLEELYAECGTGYELSLDVKDPAAATAVVAVAAAAGDEALRRLWLCGDDWEVVASWRALSDDVRLVDSTRLRRMREGPERRAASLADAGVDAASMPWTDWTGGLTTLFHRFGRYALAWDAQHRRQIDEVLRMGVDGVYGDHVDRLVDALSGRPAAG